MALPRITWQDVQQLPDDGKRREAIGGELCVTPAPSVRQQEISKRVFAALLEILLPVRLGEETVGRIELREVFAP